MKQMWMGFLGFLICAGILISVGCLWFAAWGFYDIGSIWGIRGLLLAFTAFLLVIVTKILE